MPVSTVNRSDRFPETRDIRGNGDQVNVIGHEAVRPDLNVVMSAPRR
ncbi:MAG: hypothetical protein V1495_09135 [Pseudomonadota bacterium]